MELAVSLVIIGILVGAITSGRDVLRNARNMRLVNDFVAGWMMVYDLHLVQTGAVPGDSLDNPSRRVGNSTEALCNGENHFDLNNVFHAQGIRIPGGRGHNMEDRYVYQDSRGLNHELRVCFQNVEWSDIGVSQGVYVVNRRNVMILQGVTPELSILIDQQFDGRVDARFGRVRESTLAKSTADEHKLWSQDERSNAQGTANTGTDNSISGEMTVYVLMRY
jgi:hypothetical protein